MSFPPRAVLFATAIAAIAGFAPPTARSLPPESPDAVAVEMAAAGSNVEILDAGSVPRQLLSFSPAAGSQQTFVVVMDMEMFALANGQQVNVNPPPLEMTSAVEIQDVDARGNIRAEVVYESVRVRSDEESAIGRAMEQQMQVLQGMRATIAFDRFGKIFDTDYSLPAGLDAGTRNVFEQMFGALEEQQYPLPDVPVGIGAQWRYVRPVTLNGVTFDQTAIYTLVGRQGNIIELEVRIEQQGSEQTVTPLGMPAGVKARLLAFASRGNGRVTLALDRAMPIAGSVSTQSNTSLRLEGAQAPQALTMETTMTMEMTFESP